MKRTRNIIRQEIATAVNGCKNSMCLERILKIAENYRVMYDNERFKEMTAVEHEKMLLINKVMATDDLKKLQFLSSVLKYWI